MPNALERGLHILEYMVTHDSPISTNKIAKELDIPKTSCFRILKSLKNMQYVELAKTKSRKQKWELTYKLNIYADIVDDKSDLRKLARPDLEELANNLNLCVQLGILFNDKIMYIDDIKLPNKVLRVYAAKWSLLDIHACAAGITMAAYLPEQRLNEILDTYGLPKLTENTVTDRNEFLKMLKKVQKNFYAVDNEYYARGIKCVASPIFNVRNKNVAAVGVTGHSDEFEEDRMPDIIKNVKKTAVNISKKLGCNKLPELVNF